MSRLSAVELDLSRLPPPYILERLTFEEELAAIKAEFRARWAVRRAANPSLPDFETLDNESAPIAALLEAASYRAMVIRAAANDAARATMVAFSYGPDLDHIAARYGVTRRLITPASGQHPAVYENDIELRRRVQLAPEAFSTAGSAGSYIFHALDAAPNLIDVTAPADDPGPYARVRVTCLSRLGDGTPTPEDLDRVRSRLGQRGIKPATVPYSVNAAAIVPYSIVLKLWIRPGPDAASVKANAEAALAAMVAERRALGRDILREAIMSAARVSGVERVELISPATDVPLNETQAGHCTVITVTTGITND